MQYNIVPKALDANNIENIEQIIGYKFKNKELLIQALTTRAKNSKLNYERFEYLGDTVLELIIAKILLHEYPNAN